MTAYRTIGVKGSEIFYREGGDPSAPTLLLLHGAPLSHISWRLVAPQLAASNTVVIPDLRGYGDSGKPADGIDEMRGMYFGRASRVHFGKDGCRAHGGVEQREQWKSGYVDTSR